MSNKVLQEFEEQKAALEHSNDFPADFRELLDYGVERAGDGGGVNFFDQGRALSAIELRDEVYRLADGLHKLGVSKGTHAAVMLSNRIEFPLTWLALGVLGAVMVPVNTRYTSEELDYQFNDGDVEFLVIESAFLDTLQGMQQRPLCLSDDRLVVVSDQEAPPYRNWLSLIIDGDAGYRPDWEIDSQQLLNIQYTSGTTGFPKGCMLTQRSWIVFGCQVAALADEKITSVLADHPFFYIDPQWQLVMALYEGATIHYAAKLSSSRFVERLKKYNIEFSLFPRPILGEYGEPGDRETSLKKLLAVAAGVDGIRNIRRRFDVYATDGYGMTEIGVALRVPDALQDPAADGSCGVPAPFRECRIMCEDGSEAKTGEAGELWVRGDGILLGYYNKPEANAEAFVDGWFRTGDLFIRDENGYFRIVGRTKDMIRRSSENISALEVEQVLTMVPGVKQAAVVAVPDDYRGEEVKAYLLLEEGETAESVPPQFVNDSCKDKLAEFKLPRFIEYVSDFPYTPTQKVAKQKLIAQKKDLRQGSWDTLK